MKTCQDVSAAGRRAGIKDGTRSGLWSVMADAIEALRPRIVVVENVRGLLSATAHRMEPDEATVGDGAGRPVLRAAGAVLGDLADIGYDAQWATLAAGDIGAPHRRERVFIVATAHADSERCSLENHARGREPDLAGRGGWCASKGCGETPCGGSPSSIELLPTPTCQDGKNTAGPSQYKRNTRPLNVEVTLLPTPQAADGNGGKTSHPDIRRANGHSVNLSETAVNLLCTPSASDGAGGKDLRTTVTLLPTPNAIDGSAGSVTQSMESLREGRRQQHLSDLPRLMEINGALLPTPNAQDGNGGKAPRGGRDTHNTGTKRQVPLTDLPDLLPTPCESDGVADIPYLLPTPNASDGTGGGQHPDKRVGHSRQLIDYALLCTPAASDGAGGTSRSGGRIDEPLLPTPRAQEPGTTSDGYGDCLNDATSEMATAWGKYEPAIRRWESLTRPAPAPTEPNKNGNPRLAAAFSEWLMGWPAGWVTDPAIGISRNDQLRIIGNGVVSLQCEVALRYLLSVATVTA